MAVSQIAGFTIANLLEIEAGTKAARVTLRPEDYGALGFFSLAQTSGLMAAGLGAAAPVWAFRWGDATRLALVKRVVVSVGNDATAFAAGSILLKLFVARSWSLSDSSGTSMLPVSNENKLRTTGMATTLLTDCRISNTATLTAGTRTKDGNPIGCVVAGVPATAGSNLVPPTDIFVAQPGDHPLVLAVNEGLVLEATVPITGTWKLGVRVAWGEVTSY